MAKISIRTTLRPGDILANRYRVERLLGSGKFAHVYLAQDQQTKEPVAIKILGKKAARNETSRLFFKRECLLLHDLRHPNIVRYLHQGYETGTLFLVMEFFDGLPLSKWLAEKKVSLTAFNEVMRQVFETVIYLHAQGKVHLDLTPNNILVRETLTSKRTIYDVRIIDFGIADTIGASRLRSSGAQGFAAPEQRANHAPSATMDQFSLGVLLYIACTGYLPEFEIRQLAHADESFEAVPRPRQLAPWVSPEMSQVVSRAIALEPEERYTSIEALFAAWRAAAPAGTSPPEAQTLPRFDPEIQRTPLFFRSPRIRRLGRWLAALFFLVMIVALAYR